MQQTVVFIILASLFLRSAFVIAFVELNELHTHKHLKEYAAINSNGHDSLDTEDGYHSHSHKHSEDGEEHEHSHHATISFGDSFSPFIAIDRKITLSPKQPTSLLTNTISIYFNPDLQNLFRPPIVENNLFSTFI